MRVLGSSVLALEAIVVLLAIPLVLSTSTLPTGAVVGGGFALAALLLATIGVLGRSWGPYVGSGLQVPVVLSGIVAPAMFILGAIFTVLWIIAVRTGTRVDALREQRRAGPVD
jgi:hypothetical protein